MSAKHTDGPWDGFGVVGYPEQIRSRKTGNTICNVVSSYEDGLLIAAAPELLKLLKQVMPILKNEYSKLADDGYARDYLMGEIIEPARAAIAKATGEGLQ